MSYFFRGGYPFGGMGGGGFDPEGGDDIWMEGKC